MAPKKDDRADFLVQAAAYLKAQHAMKQEEIGFVLGRVAHHPDDERHDGIPQPNVSRLIKQAKQREYLEEAVVFNTARVPPDRLAEIKSLVMPPQLLRRLESVTSASGVRVREVLVLGAGLPRQPQPDDIDAALKRFGRMAAGRVAALLCESTTLGVSWGRTIGHVIESLSRSRVQQLRRTPIQFVPVSAEPSFPTRYSSTQLTRQLNDVVNDGSEEELSLAGVAEFIPLEFRGRDAEVIRRFINRTPSYRRIFGPVDPLIGKVDTLLTSIGFAERPLGHRNKGLLEAGELDAKELRSLVVGDIAGVLIARPNLNAVDRRRVADLNSMWTGITLEHIARIATAAQQTGHPGIIVVSIGRQKAEMLSEIIRLGLVNQLIIDEDLAEALKGRLQA